MYRHAYIYIYVATINEEVGHEFAKEQSGRQNAGF